MPDSTVRFVDANGVRQVVNVPYQYTSDFKDSVQPNSNIAMGSPVGALYLLVDALIKRATEA